MSAVKSLAYANYQSCDMAAALRSCDPYAKDLYLKSRASSQAENSLHGRIEAQHV